MDEMAVDVEERRAVVLDVHDVGVPELVVERAQAWDFRLFAYRCAPLRLCVERQHLLRIRPQVVNAVLVRRVGGEPLGRLVAAGDLAHLFPQRDGGARVVARARGELDADAVGLGLVQARVRQVERYVGHLPGDVLAHLSDAEQSADDADGRLRAHLARHALARVLAKRVRDLMPHDCGDLVVGRVQLLDQTGVDRHLPRRHAPGVHFVDGNHVHFPGPLAGVVAESDRMRDEALGDLLYALHHGRVAVQYAFLLRLGHHLRVRLDRAGVDFLRRDHHALIAIDADHARLGRVDALATGNERRRGGAGYQEIADHKLSSLPGLPGNRALTPIFTTPLV